jgi:hypothetical protein
MPYGGCLDTSRPFVRSSLQAKAKPIPGGRAYSEGLFLKRLQSKGGTARRCSPATEGDRRHAAVVGRARPPRPVVRCNSGCRGNQRRTLAPAPGEISRPTDAERATLEQEDERRVFCPPTRTGGRVLRPSPMALTVSWQAQRKRMNSITPLGRRTPSTPGRLKAPGTPTASAPQETRARSGSFRQRRWL